jgi:hypothetical protein
MTPRHTTGQLRGGAAHPPGGGDTTGSQGRTRPAEQDRRSEPDRGYHRAVEPAAETRVLVGLSAVIVAVTEEQPRFLTVTRAEHALVSQDDLHPTLSGGEPWAALPFGPLDPEGDRTLDLGLRGWVSRQTGLDLGYVEQLYTFGDRFRAPQALAGAPRFLSIAYLALAREGRVAGVGEARWRDIYDFLPWEDWREGRPALIEQRIAPALASWAGAVREPGERGRRRERVDICFGLHGAAWDGDRVLDRYELLYEMRLVPRSAADRGGGQPGLGEPMVLDHRRILATALSRLRGKIRYRPVVFELLPPTFTLLQLQRTVEALAGVVLHKQNFRRLVEKGGLVEETGQIEARTGGRPAKLFRFRREVLRERLAPGVRLPGTRPRT